LIPVQFGNRKWGSKTKVGSYAKLSNAMQGLFQKLVVDKRIEGWNMVSTTMTSNESMSMMKSKSKYIVHPQDESLVRHLQPPLPHPRCLLAAKHHHIPF
jgi:hypothetical protein